MADTCRSCHAPVRWVRTAKGQPMPLDRDPNPAGNVLLDAHGRAEVCRQGDPRLLEARPVYMPHHATCPDAKGWRR